jgi:cytosine/adenosine deaminase-related metal-dependent hydrolase
MRCFVAPGYASGRWTMESPTTIGYKWDEARGRRLFEAALATIDELEKDPSGRFSGIIYPAQVDTCTEDLFRESIALAKETNRPITTHASQAVLEVHEMIRRHGVTPIQWLSRIGFLGPNAILGHVIFVDEHSSIRWHTRRDIDLLAETGTSVAHCPSPFARYGEALQSFGEYRRRGVNVGIGTDVAPLNMLEEMRLAIVAGRVMTRDIRDANTSSVFDAATIGGARALGRDDIGRLECGAKADLVMVDLGCPQMQPVRDPLRALVFSAADRAVRHVFVDGVQVVKDGEPVGLDPRNAFKVLQAEQERMLAETRSRDYAGRAAHEISPLAYPVT